jgi:hypothetical protein
VGSQGLSEYTKQKKHKKQHYELKKKETSNELMPDHHQAPLNESIKERKTSVPNQDIQHAGGSMLSAVHVNAGVTNLFNTEDSNLRTKSPRSPSHGVNKKESTIRKVEF